MATPPSKSRQGDERKYQYVVSDPEKLLNRHFSTIGIDDVFLSPPAHPLLSAYLSQGGYSESFSSWEFVGTIKTNPEDFVVREVFPPDRTIPGLSKEALSLLHVANILDHNMPVQNFPDDKEQPKKDDEEATAPTVSSEHNDNAARSTTSGEPGQEEPAEVQVPKEPPTPFEAITSFLTKALSTHAESAIATTDEQLLSSLRNLHDEAQERIKSIASGSENVVAPTALWIPSICSTSNTPADKAERGAFHRAFKVEFPLLLAQNAQRNHDDAPDSGAQWMKAKVDEKYDELIPHLLSPEKDLIDLFLFEKRGFEEESKKNDEMPPPKRRRKHGNDSFDRNTDDSSSKIILRLKPGASKEDRRSCHRIISSCCKLFGTSTINDFPLLDDAKNAESAVDERKSNPSKDDDDDDDADEIPKATVAVAVSWQKHLIKSNIKRKQRADKNKGDGGNPTEKYSNLLCVLRKRRKEHLTALQKVAKCLRCRQSDVGVAGIKDMHAVTYQFCTIRNMGAKRASHGIKQLRQYGIELGNLCQVDWTLNNGDLEGNQFEILIRDVHRISVESKGEQPAIEKIIPCDLIHVQEMAERIKQNGFINFYGEQRLGAPGNKSEVGVRSFDIGRAMLQHRYSDAIDLLMTGRLVCRGDNEREGEDILRVRQVWKDSGGDPTATLKAFQGKDIFTREKTVLKGLQRYGKDRPLEALRCLSHSMRIFWINAYQSRVWNAVASERIKKFGNRVLKGDLYLDGNDTTRSDVKVVESDDSSVQLSQVVLPLPGNNVQYPENELGDCYKRILDKDGVEFEKGGSVESTAKGSYRRVVVHPSGVEVCENAEGTFKLTFQLPKGSYATMLLREMMLTTATR
jgi:TruD family tRNA pseudouridine synthase